MMSRSPEPGVRELIVFSPVVSQVWREGALVVATAIAVRAKAIVTSDVKDLEKLCGVANVKVPPWLEPV
jgi:hypothetical protein